MKQSPALRIFDHGFADTVLYTACRVQVFKFDKQSGFQTVFLLHIAYLDEMYEWMCRAYGLDPMGVIASGALLVAAAPEHAPALIQRYENRGIPCVHIADLVPAEQGCTMEMEQGNLPLPRYDSDEITRVF